MTLLERIAQHAAQRPAAVALRWADGELSHAGLLARVEEAKAFLSGQGASIIALDLENGPDWVVYDLAGLALDLCMVPLPAFFSPKQKRHAITRAGVEAVVSDRPGPLRDATGDLLPAPGHALRSHESGVHWLATAYAARGESAAAGSGMHKVTFTSGTTGSPKGVPLSWTQLHAVTVDLVAEVGLNVQDVHLALMPLAILLENVAGVYASLWAGATVVLAPMQDVGMRGAAGVDGVALAGALMGAGATTAIFTPQTLQALVEAIEQGQAACPPLRFGAVGGAPVSPRLLRRAASVGLPIYEGYGLSECGSVVCLNTPSAHRAGSIGRPLPHVDVAIAADGEIVVGNSGFSGYIGDSGPVAPVWHTGDIGERDADGFLYLRGRRRNVFITAFGRNVAPEWVETELTLESAIDRAAVFGDARPFNVAVINPADGASIADVEMAIARTNAGLPDYARVSRWLRADTAFSVHNGQLTGTGRLRRDQVWDDYRDAIESIYCEAISS